MGVAVVMLILLQFVPWQGSSMNEEILGNSFEIDSTLHLWEMKVDTSVGDSSDSIFSSDADEADGIGFLRTAAILATVSLAIAVAAVVMVLFDLRWVAGLVAAVATVLLVLAVIFQGVGADKISDGTLDASAGFILGIIASVLMFAATALAFVPHPGLGIRQALAEGESAERGTRFD